MRRPALLLARLAAVALTVVATSRGASAQPPRDATLARFVEAVREKARALESTSGTRLAFRSFMSSHGLSPALARIPAIGPGSPEDAAALRHFVRDMRSETVR